jgi:hypothetical protein
MKIAVIGTARLRRWLSSSLAAVFMLAGQNGATGRDLGVPESARPMTAVELYVIYRDRSWQWPDGAGRMQDQGRIFKAWSGSGADAWWAQGRWILSDSGQLCLQAKWHSQSGAYKGRTCFSHRIEGQAIYQKKEPSGEWYVFRHAKPLEGDEFSKLVPEDLVSARLEALRNSAQQSDPEGTSVAQSLKSVAIGEAQ